MARTNRIGTPSTGNVFRDLGFSEAEAAHVAVRSDLLIQVQKIVVARGLKQTAMAKVLRVTQPRVSDLLRGRIDLFTTDRLIDMLARLGVRVRLTLKPAKRLIRPSCRVRGFARSAPKSVASSDISSDIAPAKSAKGRKRTRTPAGIGRR